MPSILSMMSFFLRTDDTGANLATNSIVKTVIKDIMED